MVDRRSCAAGLVVSVPAGLVLAGLVLAGLVLASLVLAGLVLASVGPASAEDNQLIAKVDRPAVVTAAAAPGLDAGLADQPARVVVSVMAYKPPRDGVVQGVVKVQRSEGGTEQEIGRFGIFPDAEFQAADPAQAQRFSFPLPRELARGGPVKLKVQVVPLRGDGQDAQLEIGSAEIR
jgi:hypothetical protein